MRGRGSHGAAIGPIVMTFLCLCFFQGLAGRAGECARSKTSFAGIDLLRAKWFVSTSLGPTASPTDIVAHAVPTTPTLTFELGAHPWLTLFTIIEVPGQTSYGAELTIGDLEGDDETYFNGQIVGKTSGRGISDSGMSRSYYLPPTAFIEGRNVLAIQLRGSLGQTRVGIRRGPVTLGFVPRPPEGRELPVRPATSPPISETVALRSILAHDPTASGSLILAKRPGFGRFGLFYDDGLPAVSQVGPTKIRNRYPPEFSIQLDSVGSVEIARDKTEAGIDGWHKISKVSAQWRGAPLSYTVASHLFYPGALLTLEEGQSIGLRVRGGEEPPTAMVVGGDKLAAIARHASDPAVFAVIFVASRGPTCPAMVLVTSGLANITRSTDAVDLTVVRLPKQKSNPRLWIFYPYGIRGVDAPPKATSLGALLGALDEGRRNEADVLAHWLSIGASFPTAVAEYFRIVDGASRVRIYQLARYVHAFGDPTALFVPMPIPPQVTFAKTRLNYPIAGGATTATGILTFTGELWSAVANEPVAVPPRKGKLTSPRPDSLRVWHYDLPIPPLDERGLLSVAEQADWKKLLNESVADIATTIAGTAVDVLYKGRTQAFQAFSFLTPENRDLLLANTRALVPAYLDRGIWYDSVEPFSAHRFWWNYFMEGPYFDRYDMDWGNGLALYGLYTAVKYTGEWEWVAKKWSTVERMFSWFAVSDDWEWMRAANGIHGHGTGAGDCTNAAYVGALSYAKLAREVGRTEDYHYGLYAAARCALPALTRFVYNDFADSQRLKPPHSLVVGFHEGEGFLAGELNDYPWNVTSNISGNGIQPELFDLYRAYAEAPIVAYERIFDAAYPSWSDGSYVYPYRTLYRDHSGYITLPHIYLRARFALDGPDQLLERLTMARANRHYWWLAPPVLAEVLQPRSSAYVAQWGRCAFLGGNIIRQERNRVRVEAQFYNRTPPETIELVLPRLPRKIEVNDGPVPLPDIKLEGLRLKVRLRKPGLNLVAVFL